MRKRISSGVVVTQTPLGGGNNPPFFQRVSSSRSYYPSLLLTPHPPGRLTEPLVWPSDPVRREKPPVAILPPPPPSSGPGQLCDSGGELTGYACRRSPPVSLRSIVAGRRTDMRADVLMDVRNRESEGPFTVIYIHNSNTYLPLSCC